MLMNVTSRCKHCLDDCLFSRLSDLNNCQRGSMRLFVPERERGLSRAIIEFVSLAKETAQKWSTRVETCPRGHTVKISADNASADADR